jgi:hypothetical protein
MIDSWPYQEWSQVTTGPFWQYGFGDSWELWLLTIIGMIVTGLAIIGWFWVEHQKLMDQRNRLRAAGFGRQMGGTAPGPTSS